MWSRRPPKYAVATEPRVLFDPKSCPGRSLGLPPFPRAADGRGRANRIQPTPSSHHKTCHLPPLNPTSSHVGCIESQGWQAWTAHRTSAAAQQNLTRLATVSPREATRIPQSRPVFLTDKTRRWPQSSPQSSHGRPQDCTGKPFRLSAGLPAGESGLSLFALSRAREAAWRDWDNPLSELGPSERS